jgi:hypothetical protein
MRSRERDYCALPGGHPRVPRVRIITPAAKAANHSDDDSVRAVVAALEIEELVDCVNRDGVAGANAHLGAAG